MKNVYVMLSITVLFFVLSFDILFQTNIYFDITLVLIYLILVAQSALNLETSIKEVREEYILTEKKTSLFAPMIFMPFLEMSYSYGYITLIINTLVIVLLYVYVYIAMKRNNITVTKDGIKVVYLNNKKDSILFNEVDKVEFNWVYNYIKLSNSKGKKVILDISLENFLVVIKAIKVNLPPEMSVSAFNKLARFYKVFLLKSNIKYFNSI